MLKELTHVRFKNLECTRHDYAAYECFMQYPRTQEFMNKIANVRGLVNITFSDYYFTFVICEWVRQDHAEVLNEIRQIVEEEVPEKYLTTQHDSV